MLDNISTLVDQLKAVMVCAEKVKAALTDALGINSPDRFSFENLLSLDFVTPQKVSSLVDVLAEANVEISEFVLFLKGNGNRFSSLIDEMCADDGERVLKRIGGLFGVQ